MGQFQLGPSTKLVSLAIRVKDRDKMIAFYRDIIGFSLKSEENALAIMGTDNHPEERFLLEESPRADDHFGKTKKLQHIILQVPSLPELAAIAARLATQEIEYQVHVTEATVTVNLKDPEENQWVISYQKEAADQLVDAADLVCDQTDTSIRLTEAIQFVGVALNVLDQNVQQAFLADQLGFELNQQAELHSPTLSFVVTANQVSDPTVALTSDEVIGLEFIKFVLDQNDLLALEKNLLDSDYDFFIDKKKSVLTVYDSVGVEWWFERTN